MSTETDTQHVTCAWCDREDVLVWHGVLYPHSDPRDGGLCQARGQTPAGAADMALLHERIRHRGHP